MPSEKRPNTTISENGSHNNHDHGDHGDHDLDDRSTTDGDPEEDVALMEDSETEVQDQENDR